MEKELNSSSEINMALQPNAEEFSVVAPLQESGPCFEESGIPFQEILPSTIYKWVPNSSHTTSDPDVIIEEIFEDDQESE